MTNALTLLILATGCVGDTDGTETGCPVDVDTAIAQLNVADAGYQREQIHTDFTCEVGCLDSDNCITAPSTCHEDDEPYNSAISTDTADTGHMTDNAIAQVLAAKYMAIDPDCSLVTPSAAFAAYQTALAGGPPGPPPPPTGSCPEVQCTTDFAPYTSATYFDFSLGTVPFAMGGAQSTLGPACGCWVKAAPKHNPDTTGELQYVWLAALYGLVNFGTGAIVNFSPCGRTDYRAVIALNEMVVAVDAGNTTTFLRWFDDPTSITTSVPGSAKVRIASIQFSIGAVQYRWDSKNWYKRLATSPWSVDNEPPGWQCNATGLGPFDLSEDSTPYAIIDPTDLEDQRRLDTVVTAFDSSSDLTFSVGE